MSGCNFLTGVILARYLGIADFGNFALLFVILIYTNYVQIAFLVAPMQIFMPQLNTDNNGYLHSMVTIQLAFGILISMIVLAAGLLSQEHLLTLDISLEPALFSICVFFYLQQDWLRRSYFVSGTARSAFINDSISYGGQLLGIAILLLAGKLSVASSFLAIALSSATASLFALAVDRRLPSLSHVRPALGKCWHHGKHLVLSWQFEWLSTHGILLIAGAMLGTTAAGAIRAAQNIVAPVYMVFQSLENLLPVEASRRVTQHGLQAATSYLTKIGISGSLILAVACIAIATNSEWLMGIIYGPAFIKFSGLVVWQAAIIFLLYFYLLAQYFYRAAGETGKLLRASLLLSLVTVTSAILLITPLGASGVLAGVVVGLVATVVYLGLGIASITRNAPESDRMT